MKSDEYKKQLEAFFEHNPFDDDMLYLKKYIKDHPENKMGWYLLGKEYAVRGKTGKAQYCFAQAGEVFEAFEKQKVKLDPLDAMGLENPWLDEKRQNRIRKGKGLARLSAAILAGVLLGTFLPLPISLHKQESAPATEQVQVPPLAEGVKVLYTHAWAKPGEEAEMTGEFLQPAVRTKQTVFAKGRLTENGQWVNWTKAPTLLMSAERSEESGGTMTVNYLDAQTCNCKPADGTKAAEAVRSWLAEEEQLAVLRSAATAYTQNYGPLPQAIEELSRDFPQNVLPGFTETMKKAYPKLLAEQSGAPPASANQQPSGRGESTTGASGGAAGAKPVSSSSLKEPLEIIVDKERHMLALVSGKVILRSYPVGLGGDKTPEGQFVISDKVRNPNGRSDGDFGSRGMQLSDTAYAIHGTNQPRSIGQDRSLGCIRMLKEDVEELFDMTPSGTKVTIGKGMLPPETIRGSSRFQLPQLREEANPNKIYRWLN